jgi:hypothetical protein
MSMTGASPLAEAGNRRPDVARPERAFRGRPPPHCMAACADGAPALGLVPAVGDAGRDARLDLSQSARRSRDHNRARPATEFPVHTLKSQDSRPIQMFVDMFGKHLSTDDYMEFFSNRRKGNTDTFLRLDIYKAKKIATIILEEYGVRGKLTGHVITVFPEPAYAIPIFMFQLGGNAMESIALLDISPTLPEID